jgi:rubrerythrin
MFESHEEISAFWKRYAAEETGHATWLKRLRERLSADEMTAPADTNMLEMMNSLRELSMDGLLNKVENLDDAFQLAHDMESSEVNVVFSFLVDHFSADESTQAFLRTQLRSHANHLALDLPTQFRGVSARRAIKAVH